MRQSALVSEFTIPLYKPRADFLRLPWLQDGVREGAGRSSSTTSNFEEFARDMGKVLSCERRSGERELIEEREASGQQEFRETHSRP